MSGVLKQLRFTRAPPPTAKPALDVFDVIGSPHCLSFLRQIADLSWLNGVHQTLVKAAGGY